MASANHTLTALRGVRVGHAQDLRVRSGTTVVLLNPPAMAFADHRGGWPGSFDSAASDLGKTFIDRHALFLTGGDIYGYDALAWALYSSGHAEEALAPMTEALRLGTRDARLFFHAGMIAQRLGKTEQAIQWLEQTLATNPHFHILQAEVARATLTELRSSARSARREKHHRG